MKNLFITAAALLLASTTFAASIQAARIDASGKNIEVDVRYSGGCLEHKFELKINQCFEISPVMCSAQLVDVTPGLDACEAIISKTVVLNLAQAGLNEEYFSRGSLTISGSGQSQATVTLPDFSVSGPAPQKDNKVTCVTHTGSKLEINSTQRSVSIQTVNNEQSSYSITDMDMMSIETFPAIDQTTYSLNDGRKIVTEFRDSNVGIGYWIRVNGEASPEFSCQQK